jgi:hypothetical protein
MELLERGQRWTQKRLKESGLPTGKTLTTLELSRLPEPVRRQLPTLCEGHFVGRAHNILAFGLPGRGKTHLLCAIGQALIERGYRVFFTPTFKRVQRLLSAKHDLRLEKELRRLDGYAVVILDGIGYLQKQLRMTFETFTDRRRGKNTRYPLVEAALSAFSVFFMQSPSFLEHQRTLQDTQGKNNAQPLFGVHQVPTDNHIRSLLDAVDPAQVYPMFPYIFTGLQQAGVVDSYRAVGNRLLLTLDGTRYFSSQKIHCPYCSTQHHANGQVTYFHSVLTPLVVKPGVDKVIPLAPEFVRPQDGHAKQDCELNAAKRWLGRWGSEYAPLGVTVLGDDLYCHEPSRGSCWRRDLNSFWSANPSRIRCFMSGSSFWIRVAASKPGSVNGGPANATRSTPIGTSPRCHCGTETTPWW